MDRECETADFDRRFDLFGLKRSVLEYDPWSFGSSDEVKVVGTRLTYIDLVDSVVMLEKNQIFLHCDRKHDCTPTSHLATTS